MAIQDHEVYQRIGTEGFTRLVNAFYQQIPSDCVLAPMYPADDLEGAEERLRDFLIYRFGGPQTYIEQRGHPRLRARHAPFPIDQTARDRWMQLMTHAFEVANLPPEVCQHLHHFFSDMTTFLVNRHA
jgi:hemoglobin